jgi:hypothetical protein
MADELELDELGMIAVADARRRLEERGLDPDDYPMLLGALGPALEQLVLAREADRPLGEYRGHVDELFARLDAARPVDRLPLPPRRRLRRF